MTIIDSSLNGVFLEENTLTDGSKVRNVIISAFPEPGEPGELRTLRIGCADPKSANELFEMLTKPAIYTVEGL